MKTTKVFLREKKITGGRKSLYLDFYPAIIHPATGKLTRREFLGLSVFERPRDAMETQHNKEQRTLAERIRAKRQLEIQNDEYGLQSDVKQKADFVAYFRQLANERKASNHDNWICALHYLEDFTGGSLPFSQLSEQVCRDFRNFLLSTPSKRTDKATLSRNSAVSYFNKFKATLKQAYKEGYLRDNLNAKVDAIKPAETHRQFLSLEELQALADAECDNPVLKSAALFSALTGLRFSDIQKLTWGEVYHSEQNGYYLQFHQKKTGGAEILPISEQAFGLFGDREKPGDLVFPGLSYSAWENIKLKKWVLRAGITKDITFHNFRHTFATLQLSLGTDIYTVSKMLGHKELKTTQIYAKIVDERKREAADKIKIKL